MKSLTLIASIFLLLSCSSKEQIVYEFRGPDRTGVYNETNLMKVWPENGPAEIWSIDSLGNGYGSPVFTEKHFFITGEIDSMAVLYCFDMDGSKVWQTTLGSEWMRSYPGGRDAPTVVGDRIYIGTGLGNLYCVKRSNGEVLWTKNLKEDFDGRLPLHGYSEAPLIDGDKIFWTPGGKTDNVVALDRFNGEVIWSNPAFGEAMGYNPARLIRLAERNILVTYSSWHLMAFDTGTGEMLWFHEQDNLKPEERKPGSGDTHSNTVIFEDGFIYYVAGDGNCGVKLEMSADGTSIKEIWRNKGFDGYMGGVVKLGDYLYGGCTAKPELRSVNALTGETTDSLRLGPGVIIAADEMIYYYSQRGEMILLKYDQGKMERVSSFRITKGTKEHFSHPVINDGILYLRRGNSMMAYDIGNLRNT